jgi:hypothetical protein
MQREIMERRGFKSSSSNNAWRQHVAYLNNCVFHYSALMYYLISNSLV